MTLALGSGAIGSPAVAAGPWQPAGLGSVPVQLFAVDGSLTDSFYAAGREAGARHGLQKTVDGGRTWSPLERGLPAGFQPAVLALSPGGEGTILAAGAEGVFRSTSAGTTWSAVRLPLPPLTAFLFDRENPRVVLAGSELRGNYRSRDGGRSWQPSNAGLPRDRYGNRPGAIQFVQHPSDSRIIYMATNGFAGVYKTVDRGLSWTPAGSGLPSASVSALGLNPASPETLFAITEKGLAKSSAGGASWQPVSSLPLIEPVAVQFEPEAKDILYVAGAKGALYRSTTGGVSWVELPSLPRPVRALASVTQPAGVALTAAAGDGLWRMPLLPTLPASPDPSRGNRLYAAQSGHHVAAHFWPAFQARGGVDRFGLPRTEEFVEDGLLVQYFQRARLEYHPEHRGTVYEVQASLLGEWLVGTQELPRIEPFESSADQRYFEETGHSVNFAFLGYFNTRGGLDALGFPISEELVENGRPVQYFQRARLEYHMEQRGASDEVQTGFVGDEVLRRRGWLE